MPKRKEPELTPEEQFRRFKEAVKRLGADEDGKHLEDVFRKIAKKPRKPSQSS